MKTIHHNKKMFIYSKEHDTTFEVHVYSETTKQIHTRDALNKYANYSILKKDKFDLIKGDE